MEPIGRGWGESVSTICVGKKIL